MLKFAFRNLLSRKLRTVLSLLGLSVAIAGMVGLFSIAQGIDRTLTQTFGQIPGLAAVQPGAPLPLFSTLPSDWGEEIAAIDGVGVVLPEVLRRANVINGLRCDAPPRLIYGSDLQTRVHLVDDLIRDSITTGRFLTPEDIDTNHAVIADPVAEQFQLKVGDSFSVNGHELELVGTYFCESLLLDVMILVDIRTVRRLEGVSDRSVSSYYIEPLPDTDKEELVERIREQFRGRKLPVWKSNDLERLLADTSPLLRVVLAIDRWIGETFRKQPTSQSAGNQSKTDAGSREFDPSRDYPGSVGPRRGERVDPEMPLEVRTAQEWGKRFDQYADDLNIFLGVLTAIGIVIAVLMIINTMVMSVSERIIEFGILKANGWSKQNVLRLITFESGLIGLAGGVLGSVIGWGTTQAVNSAWPSRVDLYASPQLLAFGVGFALVLGVLGGLYPAIWAMRMMPMDAIRRG